MKYWIRRIFIISIIIITASIQLNAYDDSNAPLTYTAPTASLHLMTVQQDVSSMKLIWRFENSLAEPVQIWRRNNTTANFEYVAQTTTETEWIDTSITVGINYCYQINTLSDANLSAESCYTVVASTGSALSDIYVGDRQVIPVNMTVAEILENNDLPAFVQVEGGADGNAQLVITPQSGDQGRHELTLSTGTDILPAAIENDDEWVLTFSDEFNGTEFKEDQWHRCYAWYLNIFNQDICTNAGNQEEQVYRSDHVSMQDGFLRLTATEQDRAGFDYSSGMISSHWNYEFQYGYAEIRTRIPKGQGLWPAFWLLNSPYQWRNEIDIFENLGHRPEWMYMSLHYRDENNNHKGTTEGFRGTDFTRDYHTIGLKWTSDVLIWYIDGVERRRVTQNIPDEPMYLIANLAVGGNWPGSPDNTTVFPAHMDIDYIRVWQQEDHIQPDADMHTLQNGDRIGAMADVKTETVEFYVLSPQIDRFMLVDAATGQDIVPVETGSIIDVATLPSKQLMLRAADSRNTIQSVSFSMAVDVWLPVQNTAPFMLNNPESPIFQTGVHDISVTAYTAPDGRSVASDPTNLRFMLIDSNQAPDMAPVPAQISYEGDAIALTLTGYDPENSPLRYVVEGLPAGLTVDALTGTISGSLAPGTASDTPYILRAIVQDEGGMADIEVFTWLIQAAYQPIVAQPLCPAGNFTIQNPNTRSVTFNWVMEGTGQSGTEILDANGTMTLNTGTVGTLITSIDGRFTASTASISNCAPTANNDTANTAHNTATNINVLANDTDPDNDALFITGISPTQFGAAQVSGNVIQYAPNSGFSGVEVIQYTIADRADGTGLTSSASLTIQVAAAPVVVVNTPPPMPTPVTTGNTNPAPPAQPPEPSNEGQGQTLPQPPAPVQNCDVNADKGNSNLTGPDYTSGIVMNNSTTCSYTFGIASYKKFDENIGNQELFDWRIVTLQPGESQVLPVSHPGCAVQVDLFHGDVIQDLSQERYGDRLISAVHLGDGNYCSR